VHRKTSEGHEVDFIYKGSALNLQKWLAGAPALSELTITEHDLEAAFSDLYAKDVAEESHV